MPFSDIPINCSAEIFQAISDVPMAHQTSCHSAKKKSVDEVCADYFFLHPQAITGYQNKIVDKYYVVRCAQLLHN